MEEGEREEEERRKGKDKGKDWVIRQRGKRRR